MSKFSDARIKVRMSISDATVGAGEASSQSGETLMQVRQLSLFFVFCVLMVSCKPSSEVGTESDTNAVPSASGAKGNTQYGVVFARGAKVEDVKPWVKRWNEVRYLPQFQRKNRGLDGRVQTYIPGTAYIYKCGSWFRGVALQETKEAAMYTLRAIRAAQSQKDVSGKTFVVWSDDLKKATNNSGETPYFVTSGWCPDKELVIY